MKYLLFGSKDFFHPFGGANDLLGGSDFIKDLKDSQILKETGEEQILWWHILDTDTMEIVCGTRLQVNGVKNIEGGYEV